MSDIVDVYFDQFQVNTGPWGATINFQISSHQPPAPGSPPESQRVATARTSLAHLKAMTFILKRQLSLFEEENGVNVEVPTRVLAALGVAREDWDAFWSHR